MVPLGWKVYDSEELEHNYNAYLGWASPVQERLYNIRLKHKRESSNDDFERLEWDVDGSIGGIAATWFLNKKDPDDKQTTGVFFLEKVYKTKNMMLPSLSIVSRRSVVTLSPQLFVQIKKNWALWWNTVNQVNYFLFFSFLFFPNTSNNRTFNGITACPQLQLNKKVMQVYGI